MSQSDNRRSGGCSLNAAIVFIVLLAIAYGLGWMHVTPATLKLKIPAQLSSLTKNDMIGANTKLLASDAQKILSVPKDEHSLQGAPSMNAEKIDVILCSASSPACGLGKKLYQEGVQTNINPAYALAFFHHESSYGTQGAAITTLSLGNLNCYKGAKCNGRFASFGSWQEGFQAWYKLIKTLYIQKWHISTVEKIIPKYAPASDGNNEQEYINSVVRDVEAWSK